MTGTCHATDQPPKFAHGLDRISQYRSYFTGSQSLTQISYYVYDGHGSTRALTDPNGNITDTYDYDAFGNLTHSATTLSSPTPNEFLFAGEQYDSNLHLYYNRARYLNTSTGRFWSMDLLREVAEDPGTLHRYLYVGADPVNETDPTGNQDEVEELGAGTVSQIADNIPTVSATQALYSVRAGLTIAAALGAQVLADPDIAGEVEGTGEQGIEVVQRSFMQLENVLSEAEAEETAIAENGSGARQVLNELFTRVPSPNPAGIEYHHIVEQGGVNASRFGQALQSFGNIVPLPEEVHQMISSFYSSAPEWLPEGMRVRDWMATQDWETQWTIGLQIVKEAFITGNITWHL